MIPNLPRPLLCRLTQRMIDRLDDLDGDTDVERNGDEMDGLLGEDEFHLTPNWMLGPGCPISDPGEDGHDAERDPADAGYAPIYGVDQHAKVMGEADAGLTFDCAEIELPPGRRRR